MKIKTGVACSTLSLVGRVFDYCRFESHPEYDVVSLIFLPSTVS